MLHSGIDRLINMQSGTYARWAVPYGWDDVFQSQLPCRTLTESWH